MCFFYWTQNLTACDLFAAFIINHSLHYTLAFVASFVEFWVETVIFGAAKRRMLIMFVGLVCMIGGQVGLFLRGV